MFLPHKVQDWWNVEGGITLSDGSRSNRFRWVLLAILGMGSPEWLFRKKAFSGWRSAHVCLIFFSQQMAVWRQLWWEPQKNWMTTPLGPLTRSKLLIAHYAGRTYERERRWAWWGVSDLQTAYLVSKFEHGGRVRPLHKGWSSLDGFRAGPESGSMDGSTDEWSWMWELASLGFSPSSGGEGSARRFCHFFHS